MKMKLSNSVIKTLAVVFLLVLTGTVRLSAIDFQFNRPSVTGTNPYIDAFRNELYAYLDEYETELNNEYGSIRANPPKLIGAFATTSVFSSGGASLRSYQGYESFAVTVGAMGGIQLPISPFTVFSDIAQIEKVVDDLYDQIVNENDLMLGVNPQILNAQLGVNTSKFLLPGLYLGLKGGWMNINPSFLPMSFQTWSIGAMANYQLIPQARVAGGLIVWRGLNVGLGFIYQKTSLNIDMPLPLDEIGDPQNLGNGFSITMNDMNVSMGIDVNTCTIPVEAVTSIRLLGFLNFSLGIGADVGFGSATLRANGDANFSLGYPSNDVQVAPIILTANMGGSNSPNIFNPKAMTSIGFSAGPAIILDIPITYYFLNNGINVGITFGVAL